MPRRMLRWLFPVVLVIVVVSYATLGIFGNLVVVALLAGPAVALARDVKKHPPDELVNKPFGMF